MVETREPWVEDLAERFGARQEVRYARRREVERMMRLAAFLPEDERTLLQQVYDHGQPASRLAPMLHLSPRQLQRRVVRLVERLGMEEFALLAECPRLLPGPVRRVGKLHFIDGLSLREVAERTGLSLYRVRQLVQTTRNTAAMWSREVKR